MSYPIISAADLLSTIHSSRAPRIVDTRPGAEPYAQGHIEGAVHADLNRDLSGALAPGFDPSRGGRHPLPSLDLFTKLLGTWGITPETPVVVYDQEDGSNAASRLWWMLRSIGHEDVSVLDGGFKAALESDLPISQTEPDVEQAGAYPAHAWNRPTFDIDDVDRARTDDQWKVLDVRSAPRFRGETEPIDPVAGHIPGAVNLFFGENLADGRWKNADELRTQYETLLGDTPPERLIVHCGSGVTACHTLLALEAAGLRGAGLYVGSWSEWCRTERPRAGSSE